jgi:hypothetical protein
MVTYDAFHCLVASGVWFVVGMRAHARVRVRMGMCTCMCVCGLTLSNIPGWCRRNELVAFNLIVTILAAAFGFVAMIGGEIAVPHSTQCCLMGFNNRRYIRHSVRRALVHW